MFRKLIVTLALALVSNLAQSESILTIGSGDINCGKLLEGKIQSTQALVNWTQGFIVGITFVEHRDLGDANMPDSSRIKTYLQKYCQEHPLDSVMSAARAFKIELFGYSR